MQVTTLMAVMLSEKSFAETAPERRYSSHTFRYGYLVTT
jgi:hypothetical protein